MNCYLETNLLKIKHLASIRENENFRFRVFLKGKDGDRIDRIVHRLHKEITGQIDCTLCGNCCIELQPELHQDDIEVLADLENITSEQYKDDYCEIDEYNDIYLKALPCRYLDEKKCSIYDKRPKECIGFPNTHKKWFLSRLLGMINFYELCPIVFNLMEKLKDETCFRR